MEFDVAIAGYGPVGATFANILGRAGLKVAVIDPFVAIFDKPRAMVMDHEGMRVFQRAGVAEQVFQISATHPGADFVGIDGGVIKRFDPLSTPYRLGWPPNSTFVQPELEAVLRSALTQHQVDILTPWRLTNFTETGSSVRLMLRHEQTGEAREITASYLIGADGANSIVREKLGIVEEDLSFNEWWLVVDALLRRPVSLSQKLTQFCQPKRPATYIPGPGSLRRWELKLLPGETPESFEDEARVREALRDFVDVDAVDIWRAATYCFNAKVSERWRSGRVFLAGDAAHRMPPFMGQGLCAGLRDAGNLAWKLNMVLHGDASDSLLDSYQAERKPHIRTIVATSKAFGRVIGELDPEAAQNRDTEMRRALEAGQAEVIRQKHIPDLQAGLIACDIAGTPLPGSGSLFVQPVVESVASGRRGFLDDFLGMSFAVVSVKAGFADMLTPAGRIAAERICAVFASIGARTLGDVDYREDDALFAEWLRTFDASAAIIRPDGYVYGLAGNSDTLSRLLEELAESVAGQPDAKDP